MMKTKRVRTALGMLGLLSLSACGEPEQGFEVTVRDEGNKPMPNIECRAWFNRPKESGLGLKPYAVEGKTDASGMVKLSGETSFFNTGVRASAEGFYDSLVDKLWITGKDGNRWEPWPVEVDLVMKKVRKPHPMYAVRAFDNFRFRIPNLDSKEPIGFDLEAHDWVEPLGVGKVADVLIKARRRDPADTGFQPRGWVDVSFSNAGDGIQRIEDTGGSMLVGPVEAPENGYETSWSFANRNEPGETGPSDEAAFVFRTRTVLDESGRVVSARYGKIAGGISSSLYHERPSFTLTYYFNAKPNERGLEWDMKTNLAEGVEEYHWPKRP